MEGGGEALSDLNGPPADLQGADATLRHDPAAGPDGFPRRVREPINRPWLITSVRLLGNLEIEVTDTAPSSADVGTPSAEPPARELPLAGITGLGPLAKAALVALVLNLRNGRTPAQLGEAMEGQPRVPTALQSHLSAVRRTGLVVNLRSGIYRVENLTRDQVDALRFEDLYKELRNLASAGREEDRAALISKAEEALQLWIGDPVAAHGYFRDTFTLKKFADWLVDIQCWYASALIGRGQPEDRETATRLLEQIRARNPSHRLLPDLQQAVGGRPSAPAADGGQHHSPVSSAMAGPIAAEPAWLPDYRSCLRELASSVDLRGFSIEFLSSSSLAAVYTPLYARPRTPEKPPPGQLTDAARPLLETVVRQTRANLVVGESGSGKSTFLLHLCASYLAEGADRVPLFVDLGASPAISEDRLDEHGRLPWHILPYLFSSRFADLGIDISVPEVDALARLTPVVWLVDGLNEIASPEIRFALADAISVCVTRWPTAKFAVTTTEAGLAARGIPRLFQRVDVDEFRPDDIDFFLDAFSRDQDSSLTGAERKERWEPLATAVRDSAELRDMARSPLRLTAMTLAYLREKRLPDSRADLLRGAFEWLIFNKSPLLRSYVRSGRDLRTIFAELAFQMIAKEEVPLSRVGRAWAADCLRPLDCFQGSVEDFLDAAVAAGGLLIPRGPGDLGMHDAFRDYLAASRIAAKTDHPETGWWSVLAPHLDDPEWHSVVALVPGALLLLGGSERVDLFFNLLGASCLNQRISLRAGRVALGGGILHELGLTGYRLSSAPRWADAVRSVRELFDEPGDVPLNARYGAAVAYGIMGDERLAHPDATWISVPAGEYWMGAQGRAAGERNYDADAAPWESPVTKVTIGPFAIRKFPITVTEYRAFIEAGGYRPAGARYWTHGGRRWLSATRAEAPLDWDIQLSVPNEPVSGVSWHECVAYCGWLTEQGSRGNLCRLPYEREWEYVAKRDITSSQFRWGDRMHGGDEAEANWAGAFLRRKTPVGIFPASTTDDGVADLFGNVEEWCLDAWEDGRTAGADAVTRAAMRVVRGGSCIRFSRLCRPTYRSRIVEDHRYLSVGFRPVRVAAPPARASALP